MSLNSTNALSLLSASQPIQKFSKKQLLLSPGRGGNEVIVVKEGFLKVYAVRNGKEIIIDILKPVDLWLSENNSNKFFLESLTPVEVYKMSYTDFVEVVKKDPALAMSVISEITSRLEQTRLKVANIGSGNATTKVFDELSRLCTEMGNSQPQGFCRICTKLSHQQIADMVGLTRESVTHAIMRLREEQQIKVEDGAIFVNTAFM